MKNLAVLLVILVLAGISCKTKPQTQVKGQTTDVTTGSTKISSKTQGKVSHEYRATGCNTVVIVKNANTENPLVLIPMNSLSEEFDKDGLELYFNYRLLKIKNPEGCSHGIPAELTDISLK